MKDQDVSKTAQNSVQGKKEQTCSLKDMSTCTSQIRVPTLVLKRPTLLKQKGMEKHVAGERTAEASRTQQIAVPTASSDGGDLVPKRVHRLHIKKPRDTLEEMVRLQKSAGKSFQSNTIFSTRTA